MVKHMIGAMICLFISLLSCKSKNIEPDSIDSTVGMVEYLIKEDSLKLERAKLAPAKILSSEIKKDYIYIKYQNLSTKTIAAIRISWQLSNIFGEEYVLTTGENIKSVKADKIETGIWNAPEKAVKVNKAFVSEIVFTDGTKWKLENTY